MGARNKDTGARRQWGGDRREQLPIVTPPASDGTIHMAQLAIVVTVLAWIAFVWETLSKTPLGGSHETPLDLSTVAYLAIMTLLAGSALGYLVTRLGYYTRVRSHRRSRHGAVAALMDRDAPTMTVLVPSYQEDERTNRMTLLSAALQEYPDLSVVLLIDDPPEPRYAGPARMLAAAQRLPEEIQALLDGPASRYRAALEQFDRATPDPFARGGEELETVAVEYEHAADWLRAYADGYPAVDHADRFLVDKVLRALAGELATTGEALRNAAADQAALSRAHVRHLLARLTWIFGVRITSFQRKRYVSLSHEPNKAMNLNSYLGLMGGSYREVTVAGGRALVASEHEADLVVPNPDYVLTLDADSLLLPEYCLRMVHLLEQSEHERVAVAQAPYSAFPGSATRIERIAGATTDLQYMVHQGMTYYDATFWVGANAVLRKRAIDDLCEVEHRGDWEIRRYIQDRTVIEDTESSVDLGVHGWRLLNHPERLSYSATPPDFGSLCIQRQRWANGGLLILPNLWRQVKARRARGERQRLGETLLRINYMASIAWSSVALVFLLAYQFSDHLLSPLVIGISLPYFVMMAADLKHCGYRRVDVLRIYGFNLVLLPVNLAGMGASLVQAIIGTKPAFRRTPKVRSRTSPGLTFVVLPYVLVGFSILTLLRGYHHGHWLNAGVAALNAVLATYAIVAYIGVRNSIVDVYVNIVNLLYKPQGGAQRGKQEPRRSRRRRARAAAVAEQPPVPAPHWSQTLEYLPEAPPRRPLHARTAGSLRGVHPHPAVAGRDPLAHAPLVAAADRSKE